MHPFFTVYEGVKSAVKTEDVLLFDLSKDDPNKIIDIFDPISDKILVMGEEYYCWTKLHFAHDKIFAFFVLAPDTTTNGIFFFPAPKTVSNNLRRIRPDIRKITLLQSQSTSNNFFHKRVRDELASQGFSIQTTDFAYNDADSSFSMLSKIIRKSDAIITLPDSEVLSFPVYRFIARNALAESRPLFTLTKRHLDMGGAFWFNIDYYETGRKLGKLAVNNKTGWFFAPANLKANKYILKKEHITYEEK